MQLTLLSPGVCWSVNPDHRPQHGLSHASEQCSFLVFSNMAELVFRFPTAFASSSVMTTSSAARLSGSSAFVPQCPARQQAPPHAKRSRTLMCAPPVSSPEPFDPADLENAPGFDPKIFTDEELKALEPTTFRWSEIPFEGLEEELAAVDEYVREEELEEDDSWAVFLRGSAYEHWGRPSLATAQYELVRHAKGLRLIPELWLRKAYNSFKTGDVVLADRLHDIAELIQCEAVGNQMHFSFWFEKEFKNFKPRHNGPPFAVQTAVCKYSNKRFDEARMGLCSLLCTMLDSQEDLEHAALWLLATSARINSTIAVDVNGLPKNDVQLSEKALSGNLQPVTEALKPIAELFLSGSKAALEKAEEITSSGGEHGLVRALYMALYYDSLARDEEQRDRWLDVVGAMEPPAITHDSVDFMYWAGKNRLTIPPNSSTQLPPLQVPL